MGTTGTITGAYRVFCEQDKAVSIVGLQPEEGSSIPGIRRWPAEYMPGIFNAQLVDVVLDIHQQDAENTMRMLAVKEGFSGGVSSGGAVAGALRCPRKSARGSGGDRLMIAAIATFLPGVFGEEHFTQGGNLNFGHVEQVGSVGVVHGAEPAFALLTKDIGLRAA